jgi:hypothetical protein
LHETCDWRMAIREAVATVRPCGNQAQHYHLLHAPSVGLSGSMGAADDPSYHGSNPMLSGALVVMLPFSCPATRVLEA